MAAGFNMTVKGLDKLVGLLDKLPKTVQTELSAEMKVTADEIRDGAKRDAPVDEARVKNSISSKKVGLLMFEIVAQSNYAGYLEFGTKSNTVIPAGLESVASQLRGKSSSTGSPYEAIIKWVKRKGIAGTYSTKSRKQSRSRASVANIKQVQPAEKRLRDRVANIIRKLI